MHCKELFCYNYVNNVMKIPQLMSWQTSQLDKKWKNNKKTKINWCIYRHYE